MRLYWLDVVKVRRLMVFFAVLLCPGALKAVRSQELRQLLPLADPARLTKGIIGVTCDNTRSVPQSLRSHVVILLPLDVSATQLAVGEESLAPQPCDTSPDAPNGSCEYDEARREIRYYPPLEFAPKSALAGRNKTRLIMIYVNGRTRAGDDFQGVARVRLARPAVVLVHGVNNNSLVWRGPDTDMPRPKRIGLGTYLADRNFDVLAVEHGWNDLDSAATQSVGARFFKGNGTVEWAAQRVEKTIQAALQMRRRAGFVTNRVDVVGHSYGGVVARWYIASHDSANRTSPLAPGSLAWYSYSSNDSKLPDIYKLWPALWAGQLTQVASQSYHHVRKLITLGSPWRGTPISNIINEVHYPAARRGLGRVPLQWRGVRAFPLKIFIDKLVPLVGVSTDAPASEVTAVESSWLRVLNARPFREDIVYAAIAGNNNAYIESPILARFKLPQVDLYSLLSETLPEDVVPAIRLERLKKSRANLSDGLIPIWSAVIDSESHVIASSHNALLWDEDSKDRVSTLLGDENLKNGTQLNTLWSAPWNFELKEGDKPLAEWKFAPGVMAPLDRSEDYQNLDGVARLNPAQLGSFKP